jgi:hypothetical protein
MKRMPRSLKDVNRIAQIARKVVSVFDGRVLTLQQACAEIRKGDPTDLRYHQGGDHDGENSD